MTRWVNSLGEYPGWLRQHLSQMKRDDRKRAQLILHAVRNEIAHRRRIAREAEAVMRLNQLMRPP